MSARIALSAFALLLPVVLIAAEPHPLAVPQGTYPAQGYPWENNALGLDDVVPKPWTPVTISQGSVVVWGREYEIASGPLPAQISSQGVNLLAAPPTLEVVVGGEALEWSEASEVECSDTRASWSARAAAEGCTVVGSASVEYDGFLRVDLQIRPEASVMLDGLRLTIPFAPDVARGYSRYIDYDFEAQKLDRADYVNSFGRLDEPMATAFKPTLWIGNHEVGVEWSAETNAGWSPLVSEDAIRIEPGPEAVTLSVTMVDEPVEVTEARTFSFALYPTPVKPLPEDWRRIVLGQGWNYRDAIGPDTHRVYSIGWHGNFPYRYPGLPLLEPAAAESAKEVSIAGSEPAERMASSLREAAEAGVKLIPYGALYALPATLPRNEWEDYAETWRTGNPIGASPIRNWALLQGIEAGDPSAYYICLYPKSLRDFLVWTYVDAMETYDTNGLYFDLAAPNVLCENTHHGHPPATGGTQYYPLWHQRALMKRLHVACKQRNPDYLISVHHAKCPITVSGFADLVLSGEALISFFMRDGFTVAEARTDPEAYTPNYGLVPEMLFRLQYLQTLGVMNEILPEIIVWNRELMHQHPDLLERYTRSLLARVVAYSIPVYPARMDLDLYDRVVRTWVDFGTLEEDVRFVRPEEVGEFIASGGEALTVSLFLHPREDKALLALANLTDTPVDRTVRLKTEALAEAGVDLDVDCAAVEAISLEPIPGGVDAGWFVSIPAQDFRLLRLGQ